MLIEKRLFCYIFWMKPEGMLAVGKNPLFRIDYELSSRFTLYLADKAGFSNILFVIYNWPIIIRVILRYR